MHPHITEQLGRQIHEDRLRSAQCQARVAHRSPHNNIRHRAGRALVSIGLRIADESGDA